MGRHDVRGAPVQPPWWRPARSPSAWAWGCALALASMAEAGWWIVGVARRWWWVPLALVVAVVVATGAVVLGMALTA